MATFVFQLRARDLAVKSAEMAFLRVSTYYNVICKIAVGRIEYHPKFHLPLLRSAKSGWNDVGKL